MIIAQGGNIGGWSLYAKGGKLKYCYNLLGIKYFYVEADSALPAGEHQVRMEFAYDGGGLGKGGTASLFVDGKKVGAGQSRRHGSDGLLCRRRLRCGRGHGAPVSEDYGPRGNEFSGRVKGVEIAIDDAAEDTRTTSSAGGSRAHRHGAAIERTGKRQSATAADCRAAASLHAICHERHRQSRGSVAVME